MTDFGLDDDIVNEDILIDTLRWHGLLPSVLNVCARKEETKTLYCDRQHDTMTEDINKEITNDT